MAQAGFIKEGMDAKESGDHQKLVEVYDKACNEGKASGCYNLAVLYSEGTGNVAPRTMPKLLNCMKKRVRLILQRRVIT